MGFKFTGYSGTDGEIESDKKALRTVITPRGAGFAVSNLTAAMTAGLAANSSVFAMRIDPSATLKAHIERIRLQWTTIAVFTTPVTAGRRLGLYRGSGAATSGGTGITAAVRKHSSTGTISEFDNASGGDIRISTQSGLTTTGITFETDPLKQMSLAHVGAAGAFFEEIWDFNATANSPIVLDAGQLLAIRNPVAMDAGGTWQLAVNVDWYEAAAY